MTYPPKFTPVQGGPAPKNRSGIPVVPVIILVIYVVYFGIFMIAPKVLSQLSQEMDPVFPPLWRLIVAVLLFMVFGTILVLNLLYKKKPDLPVRPTAPGQRSTGAPPDQQAAPRFKPVVKEAPPAAMPAPERKTVEQPVRSQVIIYPQEVEGGIFGDTYIGLGPNKVLKLRSLVVEPEYVT